MPEHADTFVYYIDVTNHVTQWGSVIVAPSQMVYEKVETPTNGQG